MDICLKYYTFYTFSEKYWGLGMRYNVERYNIRYESRNIFIPGGDNYETVQPKVDFGQGENKGTGTLCLTIEKSYAMKLLNP